MDRVSNSGYYSVDGATGACGIEHGACITCSDAGIPLKVLYVIGDDAMCEDEGGNRARVALELVAPVLVGEVLLTHGGVAIGRVGQ